MASETRNRRKSLAGVVTSKMGDKSIKVVYSYKIPHPRYRKIINRKTVVHVHDEGNEAKPGDRVRIMETRPVSRLKRWRLVEVVERAPELGGKSVAEEIEPVAGVEPTPSAETAASSSEQ